jgi:hypothetical protein
LLVQISKNDSWSSKPNKAQKLISYKFLGFQRLRSKALLITLTELMAMAAPATTGFKKPNAASGIPATL